MPTSWPKWKIRPFQFNVGVWVSTFVFFLEITSLRLACCTHIPSSLPPGAIYVLVRVDLSALVRLLLFYFYPNTQTRTPMYDYCPGDNFDCRSVPSAHFVSELKQENDSLLGRFRSLFSAASQGDCTGLLFLSLVLNLLGSIA